MDEQVRLFDQFSSSPSRLMSQRYFRFITAIFLKLQILQELKMNATTKHIEIKRATALENEVLQHP
jgi:hypothetical protein